MHGRITRNSLQDISRRAKTVIELSGASLDGTVVTSRSGAAVQSGIATLFAHCEAFDQKIRQIVREMNSRRYSFLIEGGIRRFPMIPNEGTKKLYQRVKDNGNRLDLRVLEEHRWSSSDD